MVVVNGDQEGLWPSKSESVVEIIMKSWLSNFFDKDIEMSKQWLIILFLPLNTRYRDVVVILKYDLLLKFY